MIGHFRHPVRQAEAVAYENKLKEMGVPIVARVNAGCMEGGDFWMIDEHTLAWGQVDRTDQAGVTTCATSCRSSATPWACRARLTTCTST